METNDHISSLLKKLGFNEKHIKHYLIKYLEKVEEVISLKREKRIRLTKELHTCDYDIKSIAEETGISRTTFYSYDNLLKKYVELSHEEDYKDDPNRIIKELKETIRCLQEENRLMAVRDCKEMILKKENDDLKQLVQDRDKTIERLRRTIMKVN